MRAAPRISALRRDRRRRHRRRRRTGRMLLPELHVRQAQRRRRRHRTGDRTVDDDQQRRKPEHRTAERRGRDDQLVERRRRRPLRDRRPVRRRHPERMDRLLRPLRRRSDRRPRVSERLPLDHDAALPRPGRLLRRRRRELQVHLQATHRRGLQLPDRGRRPARRLATRRSVVTSSRSRRAGTGAARGWSTSAETRAPTTRPAWAPRPAASRFSLAAATVDESAGSWPAERRQGRDDGRRRFRLARTRLWRSRAYLRLVQRRGQTHCLPAPPAPFLGGLCTSCRWAT